MRETNTPGNSSASFAIVNAPAFVAYSRYASSIKMPVSGERCLIVRTVCSMSADVCTVDVGLFGLQRNTRPAPIEARIIPSRSRASLESTGISFTGALMRWAVPAGEPYDGSPVTREWLPSQYAITAAVRISPEPVEMMTLLGFAPSMAAQASTNALTLGGG